MRISFRLSIFVILFAAILLTSPFFIFGPPVGQSFTYNVAWHSGFTEQLFSGDLYPRWISSQNEGAGSPAFYFYAPLPFWVTAISSTLLCPPCSPIAGLMLGNIVLFASSGVAFFWFAKEFASKEAATIGAVVYLVLPYHYEIDLWHRAALGEVTAYIWIPLILFGIRKLQGNLTPAFLTSTTYAALVLSHLPSALIASPIFVLYAVILHGPLRGIRLLAPPIVLGVLLASFYLLPALTTQEYITPSAWYWRPPETRLFSTTMQYGFTGKIMWALIFSTGIGIFLTIMSLKVKDKGTRRMLVFFVVGLIYSWFLMTPPSSFVWVNIEILGRIQFPWRLGIVVDVCVAGISTISISAISKSKVGIEPSMFLVGGPRRKSTAIVGFVLSAGFVSYYSFNVKDMYWLLWQTREAAYIAEVVDDIQRGVGPPEFQTRWLSQGVSGGELGELNRGVTRRELADRERWEKLLEQRPYLTSREPLVDVRQVSESSGFLAISIASEDRSLITLRHFYYPGWRARLVGSGRELPIFPTNDLGLIEISVPAGFSVVEVRRTMIREEVLGFIFSFLAAFGSFLFWIRSRCPVRTEKVGSFW